MKAISALKLFCILLLVGLFTKNVSTTNNQNFLLPFDYPDRFEADDKIKIRVELLSDKYSVLNYDYDPPQNDQEKSMKKIELSKPFEFSKVAAIFWKKKDVDVKENSIPIQLRLTCSAPFLTKWRFNAKSSAEEADNQIRYEVHPQETSTVNFTLDPWAIPFDEKSKESIGSGNVRGEVRIKEFGSKFRSGFFDCASRTEEHRISRLYIFQQFSDQEQEFADSRDEDLGLIPIRNPLPCKTHDPEIRPKLLNMTQDPPSDITNDFDYSWKSGFRRKQGNYNFNDTLQCRLRNNKSVTYRLYEIRGDQVQVDLSNLLRIQVHDSIKDGKNYFTFTCSKKYPGSVDRFESIQISSCSSPDSCTFHAPQDLRLNKTCKSSKNDKCELLLENKKDESLIDLHGRVSCTVTVEVNGATHSYHQIYFTGLDGNKLILPEDKPRTESLLKMITTSDAAGQSQISCRALKFFTMRVINVTFYYFNRQPQSSVHTNVNLLEREFHSLEFPISTNSSEKVTNITCAALPYDSQQWIIESTSVWNNSQPNLTRQESWYGHNAELHLLEYDSNIFIYSDCKKIKVSAAQVQLLSSGWTYLKETYDLLDSTHENISSSQLFLVLHPGQEDSCRDTNTNSMSGHYKKSHLTVIDCTIKLSAQGNLTGENMQTLFVEMSRLPLEGNWPAYNVSRRHMADIILYDIYKALDDKLPSLSKNADKWHQEKEKEKQNYPKANTYWFRDWFFPIYNDSREEFKNSKVLNNFRRILKQNWNKNSNDKDNDTDSSHQLNVGEFVHFWSAAVGFNLKNVYLSDSKPGKLFQWSDEYENEFKKATHDYTLVYPENLEGDEKAGNTGDAPIDTQQLIIIGVSTTAVVLLFVAMMTLIVIHRRNIKMLEAKVRGLTNQEVEQFFDGNPGLCLQQGNTPGYAFIESKPFNRDYEISQDQLIIHYNQVLGSGAYGLVMCGELKADVKRKIQNSTMVAVKTVKPNVDVMYVVALLTEIKVMCYVGKHENIARLLGALTTNIKKREVFLAIEYCSKGDLLTVLKEGHFNFKSSVDAADESSDANGSAAHFIKCQIAKNNLGMKSSEFSTIKSKVRAPRPAELETYSKLNLMQWAYQISKGMDFISSKHVIHGDLATRNVLLTGDNVAKISDFGLSRQLQNYTTYTKESQGPLPWKWLAVECLQDMQFSLESDVWAFGVTLYEIFSLGSAPYPGSSWTIEFVDDLIGGMRLKQPKYGSKDIHDIMLDCMKLEPEERISFSQATTKLKELMDNVVKDII